MWCALCAKLVRAPHAYVELRGSRSLNKPLAQSNLCYCRAVCERYARATLGNIMHVCILTRRTAQARCAAGGVHEQNLRSSEKFE